MQPTTNDVHVMETNSSADKVDEVLELLRDMLAESGLSDAEIEAALRDSGLLKYADLGALQKPYPSEHAARQASPGMFSVFRRKNDAFGTGVHAIYGKDAAGKMAVQSIRFDASKFTANEAKRWLADHGYKPNLEPAEPVEDEQDYDAGACALADKSGYSDASFETPRSDLSASDYCSVCLIDTNQPGAEKVKSKCHLPVKNTPGGPYVKAALQNAAARLNQVDCGGEEKASAKAKLISLLHGAGIETSLGKDAIDLRTDIFKSDTHLRVAYAVVYPVFPDGITDTQSDRMSPAEIEKMAHNFMLKSRNYDLHHTILDVPPGDATVVESYIAPQDLTFGTKTIVKGSWVVATKFSPQLWARVLKGEFNAYSIRGKGIRIRVPSTPITPNEADTALPNT